MPRVFYRGQPPYGRQAQADFGHYTLQATEVRRKRIHFFVMMLSRSRKKFVQFSDYPFTTHTAIDAHEEAFRFSSQAVFSLGFEAKPNRADLRIPDEKKNECYRKIKKTLLNWNSNLKTLDW